MPSVCFYFEVHQPHRVKPYGALRVGRDHHYFDDTLNEAVMRKVAAKCYLPANETILRLIERTEGRFRVSYAITGVAIEQMRRWTPEVLESFQRLAATGCVELIAETYYHSLAALYDVAELREQIALHTALMQEHFDQRPRVFRDTELIYNDAIGREISELGFEAMLVEGADDILDWRSPNFVYQMPGLPTRLLTKNYRLSDDVAFRFSTPGWPELPLTADKYARWLHGISGNGDVVNLFMDYETFGEHQWAETGIFEFLTHLPQFVLARPDWDFRTPIEVVERYPSRGELQFPRTVSWADEAHDISAWRGNDMQRRALSEIYARAPAVRQRNNPALLALWRRLQTSDHFYYMATKTRGDAAVHDYFSPNDSPYDAFIHYMNVLKDLDASVLGPDAVAPVGW